jgi:hypothetical protein
MSADEYKREYLGIPVGAHIVELARQYGRYGYRRSTALLHLNAGVSGSTTDRASGFGRSDPTMSGPMTSFADRTHDGKAFRMLCIIDEFSRESLAIRVARKLKATDVIEALCELFVSRGIPAHIRSDNVLCQEAAGGFGQQVSAHRHRPVSLN